MLLWRICDIKEEQAILKNDFDKLTFGAPLGKYMNRGVNYYPQFDNMLEEVRSLKGDERIKPILKMFPCLPKEITLFEKDEDKQKEILAKFVPYDQNNIKLSENVFLNSIKIAGFFDTFWRVPYIEKQSAYYKNKKLITINIPDKIALQYKGYGEYNKNCCSSFVYPEYAIPLYLLKPEYLNLEKLTNEEYDKLCDEARERGEQIATKNIFFDKMPFMFDG